MGGMEESKYGRYIVTKLKANISDGPWKIFSNQALKQASKDESGRILYLDSEVVQGAFYVETDWTFPFDKPQTIVQAHTHDYDEIFGMFGTNFIDPYDLCGEVEFWLDDEKHILTNSCIIFIPKGLQHGPLTYLKVDRPIFNFTSGPSKMYTVQDAYHLTAREMEIVRYVNNGLTNKEIAAALNISKLTVQTHLSNMFRKTLAKNRTALASLVESEVRPPRN
jgi:DNA-binding CsgD family transcriptional regulator